MATYDYWIDYFNNKNVWIKTDLQANTEKIFYIKKYPNHNPQPENVFLFFDDFEDLNKWEMLRVDSGKVSVANSYVTIVGGSTTGGTGYGTTIRSQELNINTPDICIEGRMKLVSGKEYGGIFVSPSNATTNSNGHGIVDGFDFGYWGNGGNAHYMRTWQNGSKKVNDYAAYTGFFAPAQNVDYRVGGCILGSDISHMAPRQDGSFVIDHTRSDSTYLGSYMIRVLIMSWTGVTWKWDYVFIRKYTDATITQNYETINDNMIKVTVTSDQDLTDYQLCFDNIPSGFIEDNNESLAISNNCARLLFAKTNGTVWYFNSNNNPIQIPHNRDQLTVDDFNNYGNHTPLTISKTKLEQLATSFDVLSYYEDFSTICNIRSITPAQIVTSKRIGLRDASEINSITALTEGSQDIRFFVSEDSFHWKYWDGTQWVVKTATMGTDPFNDGSELAFYKFDNNVNDEHNTYNGLWHGNEQYEDGIWNKAVKLDGNSYITFPGLTGYVFITFWLKINNPEGRYNICGHAGQSGYLDLYYWGTGNSPSGFGFNTWNNDCYGIHIDSINTGDFVHIGALFSTNKSDLKIYVNGELQTLQQIRGSTPNSCSIGEFRIGYNGTNQLPECTIENLHVFNRELTNEEVQQMYNEGGITLSDFDDAMTNETMNNLTWNEWKQFFENQKPTQTYFKFKIEDSSDSQRAKLTRIIINEKIQTWKEYTNINNEIKQTTEKIIITFDENGEYKINYLE